MDQPIISFRDTKPYVKLSDKTFHCSMHYALWEDDKDEFLSLINDPEFQHKGHIYNANFIFQLDALKCTTAVLNGETKGTLDFQNEFVDGKTPLRLAAIMGAPRLTKYLIERGDIVDVTPDCKQTNLFELAVEATTSKFYQDERQSLFELFSRLSYHMRERLETVRLLVQKTQNKARVRQAFVDYVHKGQHVQFAILFLAAPELCSFATVNHELNSMEKEAQNKMSLLLDVFSMVGDKLVAYLRLEEATYPKLYQIEPEIDFFLREVARKKLGVISPDYYFRFHVRPGAVMQSSYDDAGDVDDDDDVDAEEEEELSCEDLELEALRMFHYMHSFATRKNIDQADIIRQLPTLKPDDADRLNKAIEKKLSSMAPLCQHLEGLNLDISGLGLHANEKLSSMPPDLYDCLETNTKISNKGEKHLPQGLLFSRGRSFEPNVRSFHTCAGRFNFKFTPTNNWESKVIKPTKLKPFISAARFAMIAKRMIK